ncbi:MAG: response regulator transcription factor [Clostridium sp.]|nr:response regulator transcription factor [Acetatifactor muris]MCM1528147.1 response regulator transcription factor [Bacteroides sp.]MCM1564246.1 response regulator transcription factor [Clostridium sp.]
MRILFVEDNDAIVMGVEYLLKAEGFEVDAASNLKQAEKCLEGGEYDLILLDNALPDGEGFTFCRELRKRDRTPIVFLTADGEEADVVKGFDLGADDYIIKPFRNRELVSRIKNVLRRVGKGKSVLSCGRVTLDTLTGKVSVEGREVALTKLEYRILCSMMSYPGKLFTRDEILSDIWDMSGNFVNDNTLSVTMKRIREKIGDAEGNIIRTVRGLGYRMEQ